MLRFAPAIALAVAVALAPGTGALAQPADRAEARAKHDPLMVDAIPLANDMSPAAALAMAAVGHPLRYRVKTRLPQAAALSARHFGAVLRDVGEALSTALGLEPAPGALVSEVAAFTPAAEAGIVPGDIILSLDGIRVRDADAAEAVLATRAPGAMLDVSLLRRGTGTEDFLARLEAVAARGDGAASLALGELHYHNFADRRDYAAAEPHFRAAWEAGEALAAYRIGTMYHDARGVPIDLAEATRWLGRAADAGLPEARHALALLYWNQRYWTGEALIRDDAEAVRLFELAAEAGHAPSYHYLGRAYHHGYGLAADTEAARRWYEAAVEAGEVRAGFDLGVMLRDLGGAAGREQALTLFREAAAAGDPEAAQALGDMYRTGDGVPLYTRRALDFYRIAAEAGDTRAMLAMAEIMTVGYGVPRDSAGGVSWYFRAYRAGDADAGYALGYSYADGRGVPRDHARAAGYLLEAVRRGSAIALEQIVGDPGGWDIEIRMELQRLLAGQGLYEGAIDGIFGPSTLQALRAVAPGGAP